MATHTSFLEWEVPWTEELGGLWSMGSQRVELDLVTKPPPSWSLENSHCSPETMTNSQL